jgi:hypothetical protein
MVLGLANPDDCTQVEERNPPAQTEVWKNLVLIQAKDANEAFEKAYEIGRSEL